MCIKEAHHIMKETTKNQMNYLFIKTATGNTSEQSQSITNIVELERRFLLQLEAYPSFPAEDQMVIDYFCNQLRHSITTREKSEAYCNLTRMLAKFMKIGTEWLNSQYGIDLVVISTARQKSLVSEFAKLLDKSNQKDPSFISDVYGVRYITLNGGKHAINKTAFATVKLLNVLCGLSKKDRMDFAQYIKNTNQDSEVLELFLIPFVLKPLKRSDKGKFIPENFPEIELPDRQTQKLLKPFSNCIKNYFKPKANGYQSLHFILAVDSSSEYAGFEIELQARTAKMHRFAEKANASHLKYKEAVHEYREIFEPTDEELSSIMLDTFFNVRNVAEADLEGFLMPKTL